jgi:hypothetical protein
VTQVEKQEAVSRGRRDQTRFRTLEALILSAAAAAPGLLAMRADFVDPLAAWIFIAAIWVGLALAYFYLRDPQRPPLPLLPLTGFYYVIFFALPPFLIERQWWTRAGPVEQPTGIAFERITTETAILVLTAILALALGYYGARRVVGAIPSLRFARPVSWLRVRILLWLCATAYIFYLYLPAVRSSSSLSQAMTPIGLFAIGALLVAWHRGHLSDGEKIAYGALLVPLAFMFHVYDGLITPIILLFLFLLTLYWYASRRAGVVLALAICAALYIFPVLKLSNVFIVENSPAVASRVSDKLDAISVAARLFSRDSWQKEAVPIAKKNIGPPLVRRLALVVLLQYCVDRTPASIPYLHGATLTNLLTNPVPRILWPNKPAEVMGQWFGHHYRILGEDDTVTSINLPWLVEFYINFGPLGVVIGMTIVGAFLVLLEHVLLNAAMTDLEIVAGWALVFRLFYQESNLSLMLGGLISQAIFFLCFIWLAVRLFCRPTPEDTLSRP